MVWVQVHNSALKHGIGADEVVRLWLEGFDEVLVDDDEPPRYMRLAFDHQGILWEIAALSFGNGNRDLIIHAMPARKSVLKAMQRRKG